MKPEQNAARYDRNLQVETEIREPDLVWLSAAQPPFRLYGVEFDAQAGRFVRMPPAAAAKVSEGVAALSRHTAGGRLRFCTDSPVIALKAVMDSEPTMPHITLLGQSGFDLCRVTGQGIQPIHSFLPPCGGIRGSYVSLYTVGGGALEAKPGEKAEYILSFPLYDRVQAVYIGVKRSAYLAAGQGYAIEKPVVFYGSSITQGGCASRPANAYQNILSRHLDCNFINLGFSGSARGEEAMGAWLAKLEMSAFVCDYDHNAPDAAHLASTHLPLLRAVRAAHPNLPILVVSAPDVQLHPEQFAARRELLRDNVQRLREEGDRNVHFLDGESLFTGPDWASCTVDGCHPNDLGFWRMAQALEPLLAECLGIRPKTGV